MDTHEMEAFLAKLGDEVQDADEGKSGLYSRTYVRLRSDKVSTETFHLFSQNHSSQDLGMVDPKADALELSISGKDFTIKQSPGILQSTREGGTTGAAVWRASVYFAEWLGSSANPLFTQGILDSQSVILELGSGISGLVPLILRSRVREVVATDQRYATKLLRENVLGNVAQARAKPSAGKPSKPFSPAIRVLELDWETSDISSFLNINNLSSGVDAVIACDCVFNYALIQPLIQTCIDICKVRPITETNERSTERFSEHSRGRFSKEPCLCIIAQQLRQPDVLEQWLAAFMTAFRVWRVPDEILTKALAEGSGFVVHVGGFT